jgi:hypothetical protein
MNMLFLKYIISFTYLFCIYQRLTKRPQVTNESNDNSVGNSEGMRYHESKKILKARKGIVSTKSWRKKGFQNGKEASVMVLKREDNDEKR